MSAPTRVLGTPDSSDGAAEREVLERLEELLELPATERETALRNMNLPESRRQRLRELLLGHERSGDFLEPGEGISLPLAPGLPQPGERVGIYRIERPINAGGMGVVYLAWRDDGLYRQRVAIKLIQPAQLALDPVRRQGLLTSFEEERAILAQLQHPNIVHILDGGRTELGVPYLVMEFVDGVDLMRYCREQQLDVNARLELFCQVCEAVQEAHRHLIVHRDLKPGNVLVDTNGNPRLLDFGIAKLVDPLHESGTASDTQTTVLGAMTPAYASPEQIRRLPITTRSDIYSLGVILYQLLSGKRPYDTGQMTPAQVERMVCDTEPPTLSRALQDGDATPGYAQPLRRLSQDLDRIVAKALHKEPERRYGSAQELADDLRRHLAGRPVLAQPDTWRYRASKFLSRHRVASVLVGSALMLILAASGLALYQGYQARIAAQATAEINDFLLEVLGQSNVDHTGVEVSLGDVLESAAQQLDSRFGERPAIAAGVRHAIGASLLSLNRLEAAERQILTGLAEAQSVFGDAHPTTWKLADALALLRFEQGHYQEAATRLEQVVTQMQQAGQQRLPFYVTASSNLGYIHMMQGQYAAARPYVEQALAAIEQHGVSVPEDEYANILSNHAQVLHDLGELELADAGYTRARELLRRLHPEGSRDIAILLNNRALLALDLGRGEEALELMRESVEMRKRSFRGDHPVVLFGLANLTEMAVSQQRLELARSVAQEAVAMAERLYPQASDDKGKAWAMLAMVQLIQGEREAARQSHDAAEQALRGINEVPAALREDLDALAAALRDKP
ncbi:serine/threonine-protein kinase [Denitratimonas sp. CY0512]|uniref:serine/threonine-protein kinase n=1 Tax=Denitratimonas sp. CY0512 TaxID=3131940 RepID=UPI0030B7DF1A